MVLIENADVYISINIGKEKEQKMCGWNFKTVAMQCLQLDNLSHHGIRPLSKRQMGPLMLIFFFHFFFSF